MQSPPATKRMLPLIQDTLRESGKFIGKSSVSHFFVDIVTGIPLIYSGTSLISATLGASRTNSFGEKRAGGGKRSECAASGDILQHTRQRPCKLLQGRFFLLHGAVQLEHSIWICAESRIAVARIFTG